MPELESKRQVEWKWVRPPNGSFLYKDKSPRGYRPLNRHIWGHSLDDFFWISRDPVVPLMTIWSRSMIRELGENYDDNENKREPPPRKRKPWPLLKLPKRMKAESRKYGFGVVDPGSDVDSDDEFKCHTVLIDVDSDNDEKTRLLSNRDAFQKLLEKGFGKDWPPGRRELVHEALSKRKISVHDGPKLIVFKDVSEAYFLAKLNCSTCSDVGLTLCSECTVNPPPVIYVVRYNTRRPKFIEDRKGKSTTWFADPNMPCIFSESLIRIGVVVSDQNSLQEGLDSLGVIFGTKILHIPDEYVTNSQYPKARSDDPKFGDTPVVRPPVDAPELLDGVHLADLADNVPAATDGKNEENNAASSDAPGSLLQTKPPNMPPSLEEEIPLEFFPDILIVKDAAGGIIRYHSSHRAPVADEYSSILDKPVKFRRVLPSPTADPKKRSSSLAQTLRTAELRLSLSYNLGKGNHSDVYLVPLRLPHPLSARTPTGEVSVACKLAHDRSSEARKLLENEARVYASLPSHMFEEWNGYNLLTPELRNPVPVGPVAPKFYGYYKAIYDPEYYAEEEKDLDEESRKSMKAFIKGLSPILLMENCGEQIHSKEMPEDDRDQCLSLPHRLHLEDYLHNSAHIRNIVVQPGPLTLPPEHRSLKDPSFRLVDFGRTIDFSRYLEQHGIVKPGEGDICNWHDVQYGEIRNLRREILSQNRLSVNFRVYPPSLPKI